MIKDKIDNAKKYYNLSPQIKKGLLFLQENDMKKIRTGKHIIDGDEIYVNIEEYDTKKTGNIEAHKKYIDIQFIISGEENIGITTLENLTQITQYNETNDIIFYNGEINMNLMRENDFLILYPEDAHLPCQMINKPARVKKAVVKIKT